MLRLRRSALSVLLGLAILTVRWGAGPLPAVAQSASDLNSLLLQPQLDGDPQKPPRFRRRADQSDDRDAGAAPLTQIPTYGNRPGFGAGPTGFDSTNSRRTTQRRNVTAKLPTAPTALLPPTTSANTTSAPAVAASAANASSQTTPATTPDAASSATPTVVPPTNALTTGTVTPAPAPAATPAVTAASGATRFQKLQARGAVLLSDPTDPTIVNGTDAGSSRRRSLVEQNPFDPTGIQVGAFVLRPAIEVTNGYDSNPDRNATPRPSWFYVIAPELRVNSNWARHELTATLRGSYTGYEPASSLNRPDLDARVDGRIDVRDGTQINLEGRVIVGTDNPGSPNIQAGLSRLPIFTDMGATAGIDQRFNRFEITSKGLVDRTVYQSSTFTDGSVESNDDRNYNSYANQTRLSYELTPGVKPFVEGGVDSRVHDLAIDKTGVDRDSVGYYAKAGTTFELSRILTGDLALGWLARNYTDPQLPNIGGLTVDSSLVWLASALTTVKLGAKTSVTETILPGVSGAFTREVNAEIDHAFRRWLVATLKMTAATDDYVGSPRLDRRYAASAGIIYKLTREMQLKAEYRHEWLRSSLAGNDYDADVFLVGARLQR